MHGGVVIYLEGGFWSRSRLKRGVHGMNERRREVKGRETGIGVEKH